MKKKKNFKERVPHDIQERPLDRLPTDAVPGCTDKLKFMKERLERGVSLFHPRDKGIGENFLQLEDVDWNEPDVD